LYRLIITDLNDNSPQFLNSKYEFNFNETTEYPVYYSDKLNTLTINDHQMFGHNNYFNNDKNKREEDDLYTKLLYETCIEMRRQLVVNAIDKDADLNGLIKYRIVQQVHKKNVNFDSNLKSISKRNRAIDEFRVKHHHYKSKKDSSSINDINDMNELIDEAATFIIDKNGFIYLKGCQEAFFNETTHSQSSVSRQRFIEVNILT
jgi:hypothetical protein